MNPCDPISQQARQDLLDKAYALDGRHDRNHPMHGLYTALRWSTSYECLDDPNAGRSAGAVVA